MELTFKTWEEWDKFLDSLSKRQHELSTTPIAKVFESAKNDTKEVVELKDKLN